ncbi:MAG TPA: CHAD domain-containing protein [Gaiellales bacterium]|jgi:CHAD domain-containing protein
MKARRVPIDPDEPFGKAARRVLPVRARELVEQVPGVRRGDDIEHLHDLRVAARRLRAVLEVFEGAFPARRHRAILREVKQHTDRMGDARDLDVQIAFLSQFADAATAAERPGVEWLVATLQAERATAYGKLEPDLDALEENAFFDRLDELADS